MLVIFLIEELLLYWLFPVIFTPAGNKRSLFSISLSEGSLKIMISYPNRDEIIVDFGFDLHFLDY